MKKSRKKLKDINSYRKLSVGVIKAKLRKASRSIAHKPMMDEEVIYNTFKDIAFEAYCRGWDQKRLEGKSFRMRRKALLDNAFKEVRDELDDLVNQNK